MHAWPSFSPRSCRASPRRAHKVSRATPAYERAHLIESDSWLVALSVLRRLCAYQSAHAPISLCALARARSYKNTVTAGRYAFACTNSKRSACLCGGEATNIQTGGASWSSRLGCRMERTVFACGNDEVLKRDVFRVRAALTSNTAREFE